jgi:formiminotetrahydrofolate cyclodeaminase
MNRAINVNEHYRKMSDALETSIIIRLKSGKDVYAIFEHETNENFLISNEEIIKKLRALADHIEHAHTNP